MTEHSTHPSPTIVVGATDHAGPSDDGLSHVQKRALMVGAIAAALLVIGALFNVEQAVRSYLIGFLFFFGLSIGSTGFLMLQHLTGGRWGLTLRRTLEAGTRMVPIMALFFLPIAFGISSLYIWATPAGQHGAHGLHGWKAVYLTPLWFLVRTAGYFALWSFGVFILNKWSMDEDRTGDLLYAKRLERFSGPSMLIFVLSVSFASFDWVMSLDPHWYSTIFGALFIVGTGLSTLCFSVLLLSILGKRPPLAMLAKPQLFNDLGNLMLAFSMLWAYMSFSQFLIIWSGNVAEETTYYAYRIFNGGNWKFLSLFLIICHFFIPFLLLLNKRNKRKVRNLSIIATWIIVMRFVDLYWVVTPMYQQAKHQHDVLAPSRFHLSLHWLDLVAPLAVGGIWLAVFIWQLRRRPLLPPHDYRLAELEDDHHG